MVLETVNNFGKTVNKMLAGCLLGASNANGCKRFHGIWAENDGSRGRYARVLRQILSNEEKFGMKTP